MPQPEGIMAINEDPRRGSGTRQSSWSTAPAAPELDGWVCHTGRPYPELIMRRTGYAKVRSTTNAIENSPSGPEFKRVMSRLGRDAIVEGNGQKPVSLHLALLEARSIDHLRGRA